MASTFSAKSKILRERIAAAFAAARVHSALLENRKWRIENGNLLVHDIESTSKIK